MITKLIPTWPFVVGALVVGLGAGAYADHKVMQGRIDKMTIAHAEELRVREVQRVKDEVAAREEERRLTVAINNIQQGQVNEIAKIRHGYELTISGLQQRANRKPTPTGATPAPVANCQGSTGAELSREDSIFLIGEATRADEQRAALSACYQAYDAVASPQ